MMSRQARRLLREPTPAERARVEHYRQRIGAELTDLQARDQMRKDAREESTLSGELRRAVRESDLSLAEIAAANSASFCLIASAILSALPASSVR